MTRRVIRGLFRELTDEVSNNRGFHASSPPEASSAREGSWNRKLMPHFGARAGNRTLNLGIKSHTTICLLASPGVSGRLTRIRSLTPSSQGVCWRLRGSRRRCQRRYTRGSLEGAYRQPRFSQVGAGYRRIVSNVVLRLTSACSVSGLRSWGDRNRLTKLAMSSRAHLVRYRSMAAISTGLPLSPAYRSNSCPAAESSIHRSRSGGARPRCPNRRGRVSDWCREHCPVVSRVVV
jgi:hypothetical protein